jgi:predicted MPP superfamily phosphohydrolase
MRRRLGFAGFLAVAQTILFLAHYFLYWTWTFNSTPGPLWLPIAAGVASISFLSASLLAWRYHNAVVRVFYRAAAVWLGILTYLFLAAVAAWLIFGGVRLAGGNINFHQLGAILYGLAAAICLYGVFNASCTRITRATVRIANLPEAWRGRRAALVSDLHLGHVRNGSFLRRVVRTILSEEPDAIFIAGDLYDGTAIDAYRAAVPLGKLTAPKGVYFVAGNHDEFRGEADFLHAVQATGVRVLHNEKVDVDGLQIAGVPYANATQKGHLAAALDAMALDRDRASILVIHAPDHPEVAEAAGISLQLSGHTHLGQFLPWTFFARRAYREFVYGLSRIGKMQVFTSSGVGTWGPPLRLGSNPEIVMLKFE